MKKILSGLLLIVMCFSLVGCGNKEEPLTELEQYAVECVEQYKSMIANPDDLKVHDIRWRDSSHFLGEIYSGASDKDVEGKTHIYLDKSYQNENGGYTRNLTVCEVVDNNVVYFGDYSEKDNQTVSYTDKDWATKSIAKALYNNWVKLKKDDNSKISVDRVMKNIE